MGLYHSAAFCNGKINKNTFKASNPEKILNFETFFIEK
jgi:hypothetical protein